MLSIPKHEEKRKLEGGKPLKSWNKLPFILLCDRPKKERTFSCCVSNLMAFMTVRWMMAIKFLYMLFFWPLNSYNPELILISDYHSELFVYSLASLPCNLRLVLSVLYYVIAGQKFSWPSLLFHPVNFTSSLHLMITFWLITFSLVFFSPSKSHMTPQPSG